MWREHGTATSMGSIRAMLIEGGASRQMDIRASGRNELGLLEKATGAHVVGE